MALKIVLVTMLSITFAAGQKKPPVPPPEVSKTVEAMNGTWLGQMTAHVPRFPAETFDWSMNCQVVAQGAGLSCSNKGKASIGALSESCLLAFDPEGKAVHYMCVTSMGEVHDHKGKWVDDKTIEFEPLRAGFMGQPITETLRWHFPESGAIDKTSEIKLADGSTMNSNSAENGSKVSVLFSTAETKRGRIHVSKTNSRRLPFGDPLSDRARWRCGD